MIDQEKVCELEAKARDIRKLILQTIFDAGSGHAGGSLCAVDIVVSLYYHIMKHDPKQQSWADRDRFILSKGHGAPVLYAVLADCGYFPLEELKTLRRLGSHLQGHPNHNKTPGVEMTTGSLGQGFSVTCGMALGAKLRSEKQFYFVLCGDGELQEGLVWEAAMFGSKHKLDNLIAFVDRNGYQQNDTTEKIMPLEPLGLKWKAFGWDVHEIDGHDFSAIIESVELAKKTSDQPSIIIANTTKGKGVSFMENMAGWHGKSINAEELRQALDELTTKI